MTPTGVEIVLDFLTNAFDPNKIADTVARLVDPQATYVSLAFDDPDLNRIMPWAGTKHGSQAFVDNFRGITTRWDNEAVEVLHSLEQDGHVAIFGSFTQRSVKLGKAVTSPFAVYAEIDEGKITFFQYMEDTFATADSFRSGGTWTIEADPDAASPIHV